MSQNIPSKVNIFVLESVFQKNQAPKLWQQLGQILTDFNNSFTDRLSRKFATGAL